MNNFCKAAVKMGLLSLLAVMPLAAGPLLVGRAIASG